MQNEIPLLPKVYDFYKNFYGILDHFPHKAREVLTIKIEQAIIDLIGLISQASYAKETSKTEKLLEASSKVDFLKILFRLCFELRIIDQKKYFLMAEKLVEIGRMVGGWLKKSSRLQ